VEIYLLGVNRNHNWTLHLIFQTRILTDEESNFIIPSLFIVTDNDYFVIIMTIWKYKSDTVS